MFQKQKNIEHPVLFAWGQTAGATERARAVHFEGRAYQTHI